MVRRPAITILMLLALVLGCQRGGEGHPSESGENVRSARGPDIVLITVDALRPDHLGAYGYGRETSPRIDRLAAESVLFEIAVAQAGYTVPSVASFLTGMLPPFTGAKHQPEPFHPSNVSIAEVLAEAGYQTAAFIDNGLLSRLSGWNQGFGHFQCVDEDEASSIYRRAAGWLEQAPAGPFFLWIHFLDPHSPYKDRPAYYDQFRRPTDDRTWIRSAEVDDDSIHWNEDQTINAINLYDGEIRYVDRYIGMLLTRIRGLNRERGALLILTADHGEAFMEHGHKSHGYDVFDENIRVPLVINPPGSLEPIPTERRRVRRLVRLLDLFPTILDYAGLPARSVHGQSLRPLIEGRDDWTERHAISQASSGDFSIRTSQVKVIRRFEDDAFFWIDLVNDPGETRLVAWSEIPDDRREEGERLRTSLAAYIRAWDASRPGEPSEIAPETLDALRSLGYVAH